MASHYGASLRDPDRIQTCNLLIRSQMLYSVELRSHISVGIIFTLFRLQRYVVYSNPPNKSLLFRLE